jgi:hypothetical protein
MNNETTNKTEQEIFNERMNAWLDTDETKKKIKKIFLDELKKMLQQ